MSNVPDGWVRTTLREVVTHYAGGDNFLKLEYSPRGVPVLAKGDVKPFGRIEHGGRFIDPRLAEARGYSLTEPGDYLLTTRDLTQAADFLGLLAQVPSSERFLVNQGANIIRLSPEVDGRFMVYWSNGPIYRSHMKSHHVGSTQIHIRKDDFLEAPLLLPPRWEQRAIAEVLGSLDDKIEANRETSGLASIIFRLLCDELSHSPGASQRLGDLAYIALGGTPDRTKDEYWREGTIPWINSGALRSDPVMRPSAFITELGFEESSTKLIPAGAVLVAITGATMGVVARLGRQAAINQSVVAVWAEDQRVTDYIYFWLCENIQELTNAATGAAQQHVNRSNVADLILHIPDVVNTTRWSAGELLDLQPHLESECEDLAELRDALLRKLLSGELRVRDAEVQMG